MKENEFIVKLANEIKLEFPQLEVETKLSDCAYSKLIVKGDGVNPKGEFCSFPLPDKLKFFIMTFADNNGKELSTCSGESQLEVAEAWRDANPCPKKPEPIKADGRTKAGKAAKAKYAADIAQFKVDVEKWRAFKDKMMPSNYKPGVAVFTFDGKGHAEEVMNFYKDTKYWGD